MKIQHFLEEDARLLALAKPDFNSQSDNLFHGYLESPTRRFPADKAC